MGPKQDHFACIFVFSGAHRGRDRDPQSKDCRVKLGKHTCHRGMRVCTEAREERNRGESG